MSTSHTVEAAVKTMTCQALGGPCEHPHRATSADDIIKAQDRHLREAVRAGDTSHQQARDAMRGRWRHPQRAMAWYRDVKQSFAALPPR